MNSKRWTSENIKMDEFDPKTYTAKFQSNRLDYFAFINVFIYDKSKSKVHWIFHINIGFLDVLIRIKPIWIFKPND